MHKMQLIVISDLVQWCVSQSVRCPCSAKMAKHIEGLFGVETLRDPRHIVLDGSPDTPMVRGRGSDAAFAKLL